MDNDVYTVREVAKLLNYSRRTIVRMFENEPGVLVRANTKRRTLRIPRSVYERVVRKLTVR
ncbi:MAG TPA: helix-turn-helix domain-containing protein [Terriglobales bacterium]|jgi:excisionase family DNA binding protein|nr:helix-turn-helix domain-containing protein [Terriglobales bacterium]